jgi:hypothetical protein
MVPIPRDKRRKRIISCSTRAILLYLLLFSSVYAMTLWSLADTRQPQPQHPQPVYGRIDEPLKGSVSIQSQENLEQHFSSVQRPGINVAPLTIGVASTVTGCDTKSPFQDGAAVLKYSLDRHSASYGNGKYNYRTYIFYHPNATHCVLPLEALGFTLLERPTPVKVEEIRGEVLRERIVNNGCCGEVR